jgi:hypothetical protein
MGKRANWGAASQITKNANDQGKKCEYKQHCARFICSDRMAA